MEKAPTSRREIIGTLTQRSKGMGRIAFVASSTDHTDVAMSRYRTQRLRLSPAAAGGPGAGGGGLPPDRDKVTTDGGVEHKVMVTSDHAGWRSAPSQADTSSQAGRRMQKLEDSYRIEQSAN